MLGMTEGGRVLTVNVVMPPANQPHPGKIIDIFLMVQLKDESVPRMSSSAICTNVRLEAHEDCSKSLDALDCVSAPD
jgi:hypothetical protein